LLYFYQKLKNCAVYGTIFLNLFFLSLEIFVLFKVLGRFLVNNEYTIRVIL